MRLTLGSLFLFAVLGLGGVLAALFWMLSRSSEASVEEGARALREAAVERVSDEVRAYLGQRDKTVTTLEARLERGECGADLESCLFSALVSNPNLAEVTFTGARFDGEELASAGRFQVSVYRVSADAESDVCTRTVEARGSGFQARAWCRPPGAVLNPRKELPATDAADPTEFAGFTTPASPAFRGRTLSSDLSYSQLDDALPEAQRRVVVTSLKAVTGPDHAFLGVLKVGLLARKIDSLVSHARVNPVENDPFKVFLCDDQGRPLTGGAPVEVGDDLRVDVATVPAEVRAAVAATGETFDLDGRHFHVSLRDLPDTQGWRVGVVGPDDFYLGPLETRRREMLAGTLAAVALIFIGGALTLRAIRRALRHIEREARGMSAFMFESSDVKTPFADVRDTLYGIEQAKTAVRAMSRYVPTELVRQLFAENRDPKLGGELRQLSMLFTDIEGFTTLVESQPPAEVSAWLGLYFRAMTRAVHANGGSVDKFIGDAVMALWNAPTKQEDHAVAACRGALACLKETAALYAAPEWRGRPALTTRFGLHLAEVVVGNIGAPDRFSYTAIGDGVNLASRLEGLNKLYGTRLLASGAIFERAKDVLAFRHVDRVAVKGKSEPIEVYELLGERGAPSVSAVIVERYQRAWRRYAQRDFTGALEELQGLDDGPAQVLARRCAAYQQTPPPAEWNAAWVADSK